MHPQKYTPKSNINIQQLQCRVLNSTHSPSDVSEKPGGEWTVTYGLPHTIKFLFVSPWVTGLALHASLYGQLDYIYTAIYQYSISIHGCFTYKFKTSSQVMDTDFVVHVPPNFTFYSHPDTHGDCSVEGLADSATIADFWVNHTQPNQGQMD